ILGGKCWEKVQVLEKEKKVYAKCIGEGPDFSKIFEGKGAGNYNYLLSVILKNRFFPELNTTEFPFCYDGKNVYILHFFGSLYGFIIAESLYEEGMDAVDIEGKILTLNKFKISDDRFPVPKIETIKKVIGGNIVRLEDALGSGAFFYDLPQELQIEDHILNLDITGFLEFLMNIRIVEIEAPDYLKINN
ncbi:MAG: hypothetical protein ABIL18_03180, partial [candidate division WOR-3 bacterium]